MDGPLVNFLTEVDEFASKYVRKLTSQTFDETYLKAGKLGLLGVQVPTEYGGLGHAFSVKSQMCEKLAFENFGFAMSVVNSQNVAQKLCDHKLTSAIEACVLAIMSGRAKACTAITEPNAGSDISQMATLATRQDDGWVIHGQKSWIINAVDARYVVLYAQTKQMGDMSGIAAFLIDTERSGVRQYAQPDIVDLSFPGIGCFEFDGYRAAQEDMIADPDHAFKAIMNEINGARIYVASMLCGMVDCALQQAVEFGTNRTTFGKKLSEHPLWAAKIERATDDLNKVRKTVRKAQAKLDASDDVQLLAAQSKVWATQMAQQHLPELAQSLGAQGFETRYKVNNHLLGLRMAALADGSTEMLLERIEKIKAKNKAAI